MLLRVRVLSLAHERGSAMKSAIKKALKRAGYLLSPRHTIAMDVRQMRHFRCLGDLYALIQDVPGDIVECGVGRGRSFLQFAHLMSEEERIRTLWGFDSFEGFPSPGKEDESVRNPKKGEWSGTAPEDILGVLRTAGIDRDFIENQVRLVPGFFEASLGQYTGDPIAFLHIDADLYESYRDVLQAFVPYVSTGGVVLFDEYGHEKWPGATKAVDEFLQGTPWRLTHHQVGDRWYFVKTNA